MRGPLLARSEEPGAAGPPGGPPGLETSAQAKAKTKTKTQSQGNGEANARGAGGNGKGKALGLDKESVTPPPQAQGTPAGGKPEWANPGLASPPPAPSDKSRGNAYGSSKSS